MDNHSTFASDSLVADAYRRVAAIDLAPIRKKLMDGKNGPGWNEKQAEEAEQLYRCFLSLQCVYRECNPPIVPTECADEFWHQHILDTRKYERDCATLFGGFLHHFPYFGLRGPDDERALDEAGRWTFNLLTRHFGEVAEVAAHCHGSCSSCKGEA